MAEQEPLIEIKQLYGKFKDHLNLPNNTNILFSGRFGIGKTFFLRKYFEQDKDYNAVFISPVNYVVHPNENIFKLIKADIISELLVSGTIESSHVDFDSFTNYQKLQQYIYYNPLGIAKDLLNIFSRLNAEAKVAKEVIEALKEVQGRYEEWEEKNKDAKTEDEKLIAYAENIYKETNSTLVLDQMSEWIEVAVKKQKEKDSKENVLVIDDLDRLDPDHIFRILNILSTHKYEGEETIKFGFDKIIIVCDLENIKEIFHHKYGKGVDFDGFIDKFYSLEIFPFKNRDALINYIYSGFKANLTDDSKYLLACLLSFFIDNSGPKLGLNFNTRKIIKALKSIDTTLIRSFYFNETRSSALYSLAETMNSNNTKHDRFRTEQNASRHTKADLLVYIGAPDKYFCDTVDFEFLKVIKITAIALGGFENLINLFERIRLEPTRKESDRLNIKDTKIDSHRSGPLLVILHALGLLKKDIYFDFDDFRLCRGINVSEIHNEKNSLTPKFTIKLKWRGNYDGETGYFKDANAYIEYSAPPEQLSVYTTLDSIIRHKQKLHLDEL